MNSINLTLNELVTINSCLNLYLEFAKERIGYFDSFLSSEDNELNVLRAYWHDEFENVSILLKKLSK